MGVSLRLEEHNAWGIVTHSIWLLTEQPSSFTDTCIARAFDLGFPTVIPAVYDVTEGNGVVDITRFHGSSVVTVDLQLMNNPDRTVVFDELKGMCHPRKRLWLYVKRPEWDAERRILLRANTFSFQSDQSAASIWKVSLAWSNPAGVMESTNITQIDVFGGTGSGGGSDPGTPVTEGYGSGNYGAGDYGISSTPMGLALLDRRMTLEPVRRTADDVPTPTYGYGRGSYGSKGYGIDSTGTVGPGGGGNVAVRGNVPVAPTLKILGPCTNPQIIFNTVATAFYFTDLTLLEGEHLLIDVPSKQILLNSNFDTSYYSKLSLSKASGWNGWPVLEEGDNDIDFIPDTSGDGCKLIITFRDRWF